MDDIQQDDKEHLYTWGMTLADDLALGSAKFTGTAAHPMADVILNETGKNAAQRHLLVRVLDAAQLDAEKPASIETVTLKNEPNPPFTIPKFVVSSKAVAPNFKMLLFPYREGQQLPITSWNAEHTALTVAWNDQKDVIAFQPGTDGRTRISLRRNGATLADVK